MLFFSLFKNRNKLVSEHTSVADHSPVFVLAAANSAAMVCSGVACSAVVATSSAATSAGVGLCAAAALAAEQKF